MEKKTAKKLIKVKKSLEEIRERIDEDVSMVVFDILNTQIGQLAATDKDGNPLIMLDVPTGGRTFVKKKKIGERNRKGSELEAQKDVKSMRSEMTNIVKVFGKRLLKLMGKYGYQG